MTMSDLGADRQRTGTPVPATGVAVPRNGLGVGSLVLGIFGIIGPLGGLPLGIPGVVLGVLALRDVKRNKATNIKVAIAGLTVSLLSVVVTVLTLVYSMTLPDECFDSDTYPTVAEQDACFERLGA